MFTCPCCGYFIFSEKPGSYEICSICGWEDDNVQLAAPAFAGGANKPSLIDAQKNYKIYGNKTNQDLGNELRKPTENDKRDPDWWPIVIPENVDEAGLQELWQYADSEEPYYWKDPEGHKIKKEYRG